MKNIIIRIIMLFILLLPCTVFAKADLSKFFVMGDSIAAGYQNGTITPDSQQNSFPVLIAQQAGVNFIVPSLLAPPGPIPNNLAVPGERVCDTLSTTSIATNPFAILHSVMLGSSNTQISLAESSNPTTLLVAIGGNDVLLHAIVKQRIVESTISSITGLSISQIEYGLAQGDSLLINLATLISLQISSNPALKDIFLTSNDINDPNSFPACYDHLMNRISNIPSKPALIVSNIPNAMTSPYINLLISEGILNSYDVSVMTSRLDAFNTIIANEAAAHGAQLVDSYAITSDLANNGYVVNGNRLNTNFYCGIYSLDGVHPTNTIDGLIANNVIKILNSAYGAGIPPLAVETIAKKDPLIDLSQCSSPTHPAAAFNSAIQNSINLMITAGQ